MKSRLIEFLNHLKMGQNSFEISVGWSKGTIFNLNKGIRSDKLALLAAKHPELNLRWLLLGEGDMLTQPENSVTENPTLDFVIRNMASEIEEFKAKVKYLESKNDKLLDERNELLISNKNLQHMLDLERKREIASIAVGSSDVNAV